ncbi:MAG: acyltransferase [Methanosarcinales archaeon]|nr:acyltransferase [Methanosarcinales archaeon]MCD4766883.1 acyltransferase [Methanosarcinales archaeon]
MERFPSDGKYNSLWYWKHVVSPARVAYNNILMRLARISPSLGLKLWLYRMMGIRMGSNVSIALDVTMDVFFPQLIEIGDNTIIGYNTTILCHEFLIKEYATGPVVIGRDVMVGANTTILPGITIADGSVVSAHSLVNSDIEGFVGGVPARPLDRN